MASMNHFPSKTLDALKFTCYSADEIRQLSVKEVTNPRSLDALLNPTENGLYDPVFGPPTRLDDCKTCGLGSRICPGHLGHIELPLPVYQPVFFKILYYLLRGSCLKCHRILINRSKLLLLLYKIRAINRGMFQTVNRLEEAYLKASSDMPADAVQSCGIESVDDELKKVFIENLGKEKTNCTDGNDKDKTYFSKNATEMRTSLVKEFLRLTAAKQKCEMCAATRPSIRAEQNCKIYIVETKDKTKETTQHYLLPSVARDHIAKLWENDQVIIENVYGAFHDVAFNDKKDPPTEENSEDDVKKRTSAVDVLFLTVVPVPPSKYRPVMVVNGRQYENPQTSIYSKIILDCILLRTLKQNLNDEDEVIGEKEAAESVQGKTTMWNKPTDNIQVHWL